MGTVSMSHCAMSKADSISRNIGVLQTTVAELITVKEHQRRLFSLVICHFEKR